MATMFYAAYGSNLNEAQMVYRCPGAKKVCSGFIKGYRLMFKGSFTGSYLTIEKDPECEVPVGIWRVTRRDIDALNRYEGYPTFYYKRDFLVDCDDGKKHRVFAYIMHEDRRLGIPTNFYMQTCLEGYRNFGFDPKYLEEAFKYSKEGKKWAI